jgi:hypothetical protein
VFAFTDWAYRSSINYFLYTRKEFRGRSLLEGGLKVGYKSDGGWEVCGLRPQHHQPDPRDQRDRLQQPDRHDQRSADHRRIGQDQLLRRSYRHWRNGEVERARGHWVRSLIGIGPVTQGA